MFVGAAYICDPSPGQYCLSDSQPVQDCPPNVYCPMNTSLQIACPLNTGNSGNAWLVSHCISKPGYYGSPGLEATQCAPGSYANTPGNIQCLQCPPGFTTTESTGFLNCVEACVPTPGTYCPDLLGTPVTCPAGYYCDGTSTSATLCPAGTSSTNTGNTQASDCANCPSNKASAIDRLQCNVCSAGTKYVAQNPSGPNFNVQCQTCPVGSSSVEDSAECGVCFPGSYSAGAAGCKDCAPGFYADVEGLTACKPCDDGKYTYNVSADTGAYNVLWASASASACKALPGAGEGVVCLPGTYRSGPASCLTCPRGYYCPKMSNVDGDPLAVRKCPSGSFGAAAEGGAMRLEDCTESSVVDISRQFNLCGLSVNDVAALGDKQVTSMVSSLGRSIVYFTTPTAVYRLYLVQSDVTNAVEMVAGHEGTSGNVYGVLGAAARFSDLTAIGVDLDVYAASVAVVADGNMIKLIDLYTRKVDILGSTPKVGLVQKAGGIALRRNAEGKREAYVSDSINNRIIVFDLENYESRPLTGDIIGGTRGSNNGDISIARFWEPKGLAFLERNLNTSKTLLVADSKNNLIRAVDLDKGVVSNWFRPLDKTTPEFSGPVGISVSSNPSATYPLNKPFVYVSDASGVVKVIQFPTSNFEFKTVSEIQIAASNPAVDPIVLAFPTGPAALAGTKASFNQLVFLSQSAGSKTIKSFVEVGVSNTNAARGGGTGTGQCHLACPNANCEALDATQKCGNSFLEEGSTEECDNSVKSGGGCDDQCRIRPGFTCPVGQTRCVDPCVGYNYTFENKLYCEADCRVKTPRPGYTITEFCEEIDIDECNEDTHNCSSSNALCENVPGSFKCLCGSSFFGDGYKCNPTSYAVYSVVDIPALPPSSFNLKTQPELLATKKLMISNIKRAHAETLYNNMNAALKTQSSFSLNVWDLALSYSDVSVDPNYVNMSRIEVSTLFETFEMAQSAASATSRAALNLAVSKAVFGSDAVSGAALVHDSKTRTSTATSMVTAHRIDGWGMNVTSVAYNRSCTISSGIAAEQPRGGCWQVELIYMGGPAMPRSDDPSAQLQSSKNVLYLPRIDKDPAQNYLPLNPSQAFTMTTGARFPCETQSSSAAGMGVTSKATACCLRQFQAAYRPNARLQTFLNSPLYQDNVPQDYCENTQYFNDTYPDSDVVYQDPENPEDGSTNDLVVGKIDGMPHSEVTLLETLDYTTRTFRVMLTLEEDDLKQSGAIIEGNVGTEYSMVFFVGLANFKGMGGGSGKSSVMASKNMQVRVNVTKSNVLTISSFGANQDPLVSNVDMALTRIKVTDFFQPVKYLYYLRPMFIIPSNFGSPEDAAGIVPISSIRVIKTRGSALTTDVNWKQACSSESGDFFWNSSSLKTLVSNAQKQACVQSNLQICVPPMNAKQVVEFGIALPEGFLTDADFDEPNPLSIQVQFMINAKDGNMLTNVRSMLSMAIELTPFGYSKICESMQASQNLADIIQGNVYIGVAENADQWNKNVLKKTNIDVPGTQPSNGFEFATVTVQGAVMTFAAIGDSKFFEDGRNQDQFVNIHDMHTVHFLEPLGGKGGPSPKFDAAIAMFHQGKAFLPKTDNVKRTTWLEPSSSLLNLCPRKPSPTSKTCLTRTDSTYKGSVLTKIADTVVEVRVNEASSVTNMQKMMSALMLDGADTEYTRQVGRDFHQQLVTQLGLNNRYKRAYSVNPLINWGVEAVQEAFAGATSYTVCTKIIAIGMVTIASSTGVPLGRRLLSFHSTNHETNMFHEFSKLHGKQMLLSSDSAFGVRAVDGEVQDLTASKDQSSNAFLLNLDVPGKDSISQMCSLYLGAPYEKCGAVKLDVKVTGETAVKTCQMFKEQSYDTFALTMESGLHNALALQNPSSNIKGLNMLNYEMSGCDALLKWFEEQKQIAGGSGRHLFSVDGVTVPQDKFVMFVSHLLVSGGSNATSIQVNTAKLQYLSTLFGSSAWTVFLGGGATIKTIHVEETTNGNGDVYLNISVEVNNMTKPNSSDIGQIKPSLPGNQNGQNKDDMFVTDYWDSKPSVRKNSGSSVKTEAEAMAIVVINIAMCVGLAQAMLYS